MSKASLHFVCFLALAFTLSGVEARTSAAQELNIIEVTPDTEMLVQEDASGERMLVIETPTENDIGPTATTEDGAVEFDGVADDAADIDAVITDDPPVMGEEYEGTTVAEDEAHQGGLPQLNANTYYSQLFWLFVSFTLLYVLLSRMALPKVATVLSVREQTREDHLRRAKSISDEAEHIRETYERALKKAHDDAQALIGKTEGELAEDATKRQSVFMDTARGRIEKAESDIAAAKSSALASLTDVAADAVVDSARKVANMNVSKSQAQNYVEAALKEMK